MGSVLWSSLSALPATRGLLLVVTILTVTGRSADERLLAPLGGKPSLKSAPGQSPAAVVASGVRDESASASAVSPAERRSNSADPRCPSDMLPVAGQYCPELSHRCARASADGTERCFDYEPAARCIGAPIPLRFCIDRYEFPNRAGARPAVMISFLEAREACRDEGKRLCSNEEWTLACEGPARLPYPYGYSRDPQACNVDRRHRFPNTDLLSGSVGVAAEVTRLDDRAASGSFPRCVSHYGVADMSGNVDEWVQLSTKSPLNSESAPGSKGGYFGPVRARCRPTTTAHGPEFRFYQLGFRCCQSGSGERVGAN